MRSESEIPFADAPFSIPVAERLKRLPPYLFGKINKLKYEKRVAGVDVIDLGMGNPTDAPDPLIQQKLAEALQDPRNHRYSVSSGIENLRSRSGEAVLEAVWRTPGSATRSDCDNRFQGRLQPYVPGADGAGRRGGCSVTDVSDPYVCRRAGGREMSSRSMYAIQQLFLKNVAYTCEHFYPKPKVVIVNFPHNPSATVVEADFYAELVLLAKRYRFSGDQRLSPMPTSASTATERPVFLSAPGALDVGVEFTTMSKGYSMAGWRIGFCCGNEEMVRALATIKGYYDYGIFQAIQIAAIVAMRHCDAAVESVAAEYQMRRDALCEGLERLGWEIERPKAGMFVWAPIPKPWSEMGSIDFAMKLLEEGGVAVSPGRGFSEDGEGWVRLAIVENSQRLRQAVREIGRCMRTEVTETGKTEQ